MIVILSDAVGLASCLAENLREMGEEVVLVPLEEKEIHPCTSCGSCAGKTYGRCIQKDDMQKIFPLIEGSSHWVLACPIRFGGYSFTGKKVLERLSALGDVHYYIDGGEIVKEMRTGDFSAIGILEKERKEEEEAFKALHAENIRIMHCSGKSFVLGPEADTTEVAEYLRGSRV